MPSRRIDCLARHQVETVERRELFSHLRDDSRVSSDGQMAPRAAEVDGRLARSWRQEISNQLQSLQARERRRTKATPARKRFHERREAFLQKERVRRFQGAPSSKESRETKSRSLGERPIIDESPSQVWTRELVHPKSRASTMRSAKNCRNGWLQLETGCWERPACLRSSVGSTTEIPKRLQLWSRPRSALHPRRPLATGTTLTQLALPAPPLVPAKAEPGLVDAGKPRRRRRGVRKERQMEAPSAGWQQRAVPGRRV